ncbi:hypothetical protein [Truepera radiovictrix]|uniref:hypothetical protein n=1 Tax=Truepera radiovictrix TaxID=332249 RepID=UPI0003151FD3|nr:hypothetical protein [Truepera radiovictrix]WMT58583.1 hypothetical protein RCV51_06465 [Truepera radiovictrix]
MPVAVALLLAACSSGIERPEVDLETTSRQTLRTWIRSGADDRAETRSGAMTTGSARNTLTFSRDTVGLRFTNVTIPQGARITNAFVRFMPHTSDAGSTTITVRAQDVNSAPQFTNANRNISSRNLTSASVSWQPGAWRAGQVAETNDLSRVIQQVVNRSGWRSGNALVLVFTGDNRAVRTARAVDGWGTRIAPTLYVTYETSGGSGAGSSSGSTAPSSNVSSGQQEWLERLVATIDNPRYDSSNAWMDPLRMADSGDLNKYGRDLNHYLTSLILAYRTTGDRRLVQQIDTVMNRMRGTLRDTTGDGFRNWRYLMRNPDPGGRQHVGRDTHEMEEILAHSVVAAAAYTLRQAGFNSSANFWTNYLRNDFEAKWRRRKGVRSGFPFLTRNLMHPYVQWIRYHHYMGKLTGDSGYTAEARRMARIVENNMRSVNTPSGTGYVWDHRVQLSGRASNGCQPMVYVRLTTQGLADLATQGVFSNTFMQRVANGMAHVGLKSTDGQLAGNICGSGTYGGLYHFVSRPYVHLAPWDHSNRLREAAERTYNATERGRLASPRIYNIPASMVFILGR